MPLIARRDGWAQMHSTCLEGRALFSKRADIPAESCDDTDKLLDLLAGVCPVDPSPFQFPVPLSRPARERRRGPWSVSHKSLAISAVFGDTAAGDPVK